MTQRTGFDSAGIIVAGLVAIGIPWTAEASNKDQATNQAGQDKAIFGTIDRIHADEYFIKGDHGKEINLRVTKDTNVICTSGTGADLSSSREAVKDLPSSASKSPADNPGQGLEFIAKGKEGCTFQTGDYVKVVASDGGAAELIQKLSRHKADSQ